MYYTLQLQHQMGLTASTASQHYTVIEGVVTNQSLLYSGGAGRIGQQAGHADDQPLPSNLRLLSTL